MRRALIAVLLVLLNTCVPITLPRARRADGTSLPFPTGTFSPEPSRTTPPASAPVTWEKRFDNHGNADIAWDIVETPEGDLVIVGTTGHTPCQLGCNWDGWVVKTDPQGNLLWSRQFGGNGADLLTSVILVGNNYLATGSKYVFPYARQAWVLEITPDGNLAREKTLGGDQDDSGNEIIATPDKGFLLIGQTKSFGTSDGKSDVWLVELSANGETLWTRTYDLGAEDMGTSIAAFARDQFILTAVACTGNCGGLLQQGFARYMVIDAAGNILKSETFSQGLKNKFLKVKATRDGGAVIVGTTSMEEKFPSEDTWIVKLDVDANVAWMRILKSYGKYDGGFDIAQTSDGGYVVAAYSQVYQTPEMNFDNFCMLRLDAKGDVLWTQAWGGPDNDDAYSVIPSADGEFILAGFRDAVSWPLNAIPGPSDFYVIKTTATNNAKVFLPCLSNAR